MTLSSVAEAIEVLLAKADLNLLVAKYFDPAEPFAGYSFDTVGVNPVNPFSEGDLLAVTLLDVGCAPPAVRSLLGDAQRWSTLLAAISTDLDLWQIDQKGYDASNAL